MDGLVPKMGDFGMSYKTGDQIDTPRGSPGWLSPEVIMTDEDHPLTIQPGNQMWIQGCIMAMMFRDFDFDTWNEQTEGNFGKVCNESELAATIDLLFPDHKKFEGSVDWCIARCLEYDPKDRISAEELQTHLEKILADYT